MLKEICLPSSKSLSNRLLLFGLVQEMKISHVLKSEDTEVMLSCLRQLGVSVQILDSGLNFSVVLTPPARRKLPEKTQLFLGNAGTATRFLLAFLALVDFDSQEIIFDGVDRMRMRPIADLVDSLRSLGAEIVYLEKEGYLPLKVQPRMNSKIDGRYQLAVKQEVSSQYLSGMIMALPFCSGDYFLQREEIRVSDSYVELTMNLLKSLGINLELSEGGALIKISGNQQIKNNLFEVEPDWSAASYWFLRSIICSEEFLLKGLVDNSYQGDFLFLKLLIEANLLANKFTQDGLLIAPVSKEIDCSLVPSRIDCSLFPDAAMTLASLLAFCPREIELYGLSTLKYKECDRVNALIAELNSLEVKAFSTNDDNLVISGELMAHFSDLPTTKLKTYGDHRMAMSLAIFRLLNDKIAFDDFSVTKKTYPSFEKDYFAKN